MVNSSEQFIDINSVGLTLMFVHAKNSYVHRWKLWQDIFLMQESPICVMGDFNIVLGAHERSSGMISHSLPVEEFQNFITQKDLIDIEAVGNKYTWATRCINNFMAAHLDRALVSQDFMSLWDKVELVILPILCSDYHPIRLHASNHIHIGPHPFRFQDMWTHHPNFIDFVRSYWILLIHTTDLTLRLTAKLKRLKGHLRTWNANVFRNVFNEIQIATEALDATQ